MGQKRLNIALKRKRSYGDVVMTELEIAVVPCTDYARKLALNE